MTSPPLPQNWRSSLFAALAAVWACLSGSVSDDTHGHEARGPPKRIFGSLPTAVSAAFPGPKSAQGITTSSECANEWDEQSIETLLLQVSGLLGSSGPGSFEQETEGIMKFLRAMMLPEQTSEALLAEKTQAQKISDTIYGEVLLRASADLQDIDSIKPLLQVLQWISTKMEVYPSRLIIKDSVERISSNDYGNGGMNDIYMGTLTGTLVALKRPRVISMALPSQRKGLRTTFYCRSMGAIPIHHKHILPIIGILDEPAFDGFCMVSPWMAQGDLRHHLEGLTKTGQLSGGALVRNLNRWLFAISDGLAYLHELGVVHGDVRGANILVSSDGQVRLTSFGSTATTASEGYSRPTQEIDVAWVAPELIDPERFGFTSCSPTRASDVYAFAMTCVELYTSSSPFCEMSEPQVVRNVLKGKRPSRPLKLGEEMPDSLWRLVSHCWDQSPARRPTIDSAVRALSGEE